MTVLKILIAKFYFKNKGYGDALIEGIKSVNTEFFCIFNADGSFKPEELNDMYKLSKNQNYDLVFGSRYEKIQAVKMIRLLHMLETKFFHLSEWFFFHYQFLISYILMFWVKQKK